MAVHIWRHLSRGSLLGGITGFVIACVWQGQRAAAGRTAVVAGAISALLFVYLGWFVFSGTGNPDLPATTRQRCLLVWAPIVVGGSVDRDGLSTSRPSQCICDEFTRPLVTVALGNSGF